MEVGAKVQVTKHSSSYGGKFSGEFGEVVCVKTPSYNKFAVKLENRINFASNYGAYWFKPSEIIVISTIKEENIMFGNYKRAGVKFLEGNNTDIEYQYALYDYTIHQGDLVVVKTGHHGLSLAVVTTVSDEGLNLIQCNREVVAKVDMTAFEERRKRAERMTVLKAQMDSKVKELQNFAVYEMLAEKDENLKTLLAEYKDLLCN